MKILRDCIEGAIDTLATAVDGGRLPPAAARAAGEVLREFHGALDGLGRRGLTLEGRRHLAAALERLAGDEIPAELRATANDAIEPALKIAAAPTRRPGRRSITSRRRARATAQTHPSPEAGAIEARFIVAGRFGRGFEVEVKNLCLSDLKSLLRGA